jgi:hypothetical protein
MPVGSGAAWRQRRMRRNTGNHEKGSTRRAPRPRNQSAQGRKSDICFVAMGLKANPESLEEEPGSANERTDAPRVKPSRKVAARPGGTRTYAPQISEYRAGRAPAVSTPTCRAADHESLDEVNARSATARWIVAGCWIINSSPREPSGG